MNRPLEFVVKATGSQRNGEGFHPSPDDSYKIAVTVSPDTDKI